MRSEETKRREQKERVRYRVNFRVIDQFRDFGSDPGLILLLLLEYISDSPNGMDELYMEGVIDLLPEPPDRHFDRVGVAFKVYIPDLFGYEVLGEDISSPSQQQRQQQEFARCQVNLYPPRRTL